MLPAESLADAVSFFGYYDLGGLKLTNKLFSSVANRCADAIRLFGDVFKNEQKGLEFVDRFRRVEVRATAPLLELLYLASIVP